MFANGLYRLDPYLRHLSRLGRGRRRPPDLGAAGRLVRERGESRPLKGDDVSGVPDGLPGSVRCPAMVGDDRAASGNHMQVVLAEPDPDRDVGAGQPGRDRVVDTGAGNQSLRADGPRLFRLGGERTGRQVQQWLGLGERGNRGRSSVELVYRPW